MTDTQKQPGVCYVCGTDGSLASDLGRWTDETRTLCNNPTCLAADATERGEGRPISLMSRTHLVIEQARKAIIDNHGGQGTDAELVGRMAMEIAELREQQRTLIKEAARLNELIEKRDILLLASRKETDDLRRELDDYRGG